MPQGSYFKNMVALGFSGGMGMVNSARKTSWRFYNQLLMADKLGRASDYYQQRRSFKQPYRVFLAKLQKKLESLEGQGLIRISNGKIYYLIDRTDGAGRSRPLDIIFKAFGLILDSLDPAAKDEIVPSLLRKLTDAQRALFFPTTELPTDTKVRRSMVSSPLRHPKLYFQALDTAARMTLRSISPLLAEEGRMAVTKAHPRTEPRVRMFDQSLEEIKRIPSAQIIAEFEAMEQVAGVSDNFQIEEAAVVISDVHLRPETHPQTEELLRIFYFCVVKNMALIVNGDFFDFYVHKADFAEILKANPLIDLALARLPSVLWIPGNHDSDIFHYSDQIRENWPNVRLAGKRCYFDGHVYIEHGHQRDPHFQLGARRGELVVRALNYAFSPSTLDWLELAMRFVYTLKSLVTRRNEWDRFKKDSVLHRCRELFLTAADSPERALAGRGPFTRLDPMLYVGAHDHSYGAVLKTKEVIRLVHEDEKLVGADGEAALRYNNTGCINGDGDLADLLIIDYEFLHQPQGRPYIYPFAIEAEQV
ncbi:MAG: metallophosphoesterase [bacterium]